MARLTDEEIENARNVDLVDYLQRNGYILKKVGRFYTLPEHDSLRIDPQKNMWFWNSRNIGGFNIQFLQKYENKTWFEAICSLNNKSTTGIRAYTKYEPVHQEKKIPGKLILPPKNQTNTRIKAYLSKTRCIDFEVIDSLIEKELIYESSDKHEVVFLSKDKENKVRYVNKRSTLTNSSFKQDVPNSNKEYGFKTTGKSDKVYVFESPIDLLSHATVCKMQGKDWKNDNRVSLGGFADNALKKFLEDNENIKEIALFLDNDETGLRHTNRICKKYGLDYKVSMFIPKYKDLNETLIRFNKEKAENKDIKFEDYIIKLKNPFIEPKLKEVEELQEHFRKVAPDIKEYKINALISKNILALSEDNKAIFFIKDENGENIGGYELDIFNGQYDNARLIENSFKKPVFMECKKESEELFVTDNILLATEMNKYFNIAYVDDLTDVDSLENLLFEKNFKKVIFYAYEESKNIENFQTKLDILKAKYQSVEITMDIYGKESTNLLLKEEYRPKPFIKPNVGDNNELYKHLIENTKIPKTKILKMIKDSHIYQDVDRNMVFLIKDKNGIDIGGCSLNIYEKSRDIKRLESGYIPTKEENEAVSFCKCIKEQVEEMEQDF